MCPKSELVFSAFGRLEPMLPDDEPWLVLDLFKAELISMILDYLCLETAVAWGKISNKTWNIVFPAIYMKILEAQNLSF